MKLLRINPDDNVAVVLAPIVSGEVVSTGNSDITVLEGVSPGHKIALVNIAAGQPVIKYGQPIGHASTAIVAGRHVHTHNLATALDGVLEYTYTPKLANQQAREPGIFRGFRRTDGSGEPVGVGIRNEVWVIPTVGCVNATAEFLAKAARAEMPRHSSVEGIYAFGHPYGCSQLGDDHENTRRALAGLIRHPNAGGVLVLGLGCENNDIESLKELLGNYDKNRVKFLVCQDSADEIEDGIAILRDLVDYASCFRREEMPTSELIIGLKCGGSDGFSGITANPLVGAFTDRLVAEGGSVILTEVPEMFGAETLLMNRCCSPEVFDRTVDMINGFKNYYIENGQNVYENPSPGNKAGGITTLEDKSLGCVQKGGHANVVDVLNYGDQVRTRGLNLLNGPGNDLVSASSMTASGAHMILFTTGRGTPFGAPAPTAKISSNTALATKKHTWIDFDTGSVLTGVPIESLCDKFYEYVLALASGDVRAKNEDLGAREFTIFKTGVTL